MAVEKMGVLDLLDQIDEILEASTVLIPGRVLVNRDEIRELLRDIKRSLPDDVEQARWIREQSNEIISNAKKDYDAIILEAKKQADYMVEEHVISERAVQLANEIYRRADNYSRELTLSTYDYIDRMMFEFREKMAAMKTANDAYMENLYNEFEKSFGMVDHNVEKNMAELRQLADEVKDKPMPQHNPRLSANFESEE